MIGIEGYYPVNTTVEFGGKAVFQCRVRSDLMPHIQVSSNEETFEQKRQTYFQFKIKALFSFLFSLLVQVLSIFSRLLFRFFRSFFLILFFSCFLVAEKH